jgi:hypothetical protein
MVGVRFAVVLALGAATPAVAVAQEPSEAPAEAARDAAEEAAPEKPQTPRLVRTAERLVQQLDAVVAEVRDLQDQLKGTKGEDRGLLGRVLGHHPRGEAPFRRGGHLDSPPAARPPPAIRGRAAERRRVMTVERLRNESAEYRKLRADIATIRSFASARGWRQLHVLS